MVAAAIIAITTTAATNARTDHTAMGAGRTVAKEEAYPQGGKHKMSYIDDTLVASEMVQLSASRHWIDMVTPVGLGCLLGLVSIAIIVDDVNVGLGAICLVLSAAIIALYVLRWKATEIAVTNKRVILKVGIVSISSIEIYLRKIESIGVEQGILGGIFDYGDVVIRGTGGTAEVIANIAHPMRFRSELQRQLDLTQAEVSVIGTRA
jgi:hypothetical protein